MPPGSPDPPVLRSGTAQPDIAGVVLAGGASRRMGRDKATLRLPGSNETLLARAARHLTEAGASRILVATGTPGRLGPLPWDEVGDGDHAGKGPLAGLAAGLTALAAIAAVGDEDGLTTVDVALVLAVDIPFASPPLLRWLANEVQTTGVAGLIPVSSPDDRPQPLHAAYRPRAVAGFLRASLVGGDLRLLRALAAAGAVQVDLPADVASTSGDDWHRNANFPLDVRGLE